MTPESVIQSLPERLKTPGKAMVALEKLVGKDNLREIVDAFKGQVALFRELIEDIREKGLISKTIDKKKVFALGAYALMGLLTSNLFSPDSAHAAPSHGQTLENADDDDGNPQTHEALTQEGMADGVIQKVAGEHPDVQNAPFYRALVKAIHTMIPTDGVSRADLEFHVDNLFDIISSYLQRGETPPHMNTLMKLVQENLELQSRLGVETGLESDAVKADSQQIQEAESIFGKPDTKAELVQKAIGDYAEKHSDNPLKLALFVNKALRAANDNVSVAELDAALQKLVNGATQEGDQSGVPGGGAEPDKHHDQQTKDEDMQKDEGERHDERQGEKVTEAEALRLNRTINNLRSLLLTSDNAPSIDDVRHKLGLSKDAPIPDEAMKFLKISYDKVKGPRGIDSRWELPLREAGRIIFQANR